jgi:hypothetical protein
MKYYLAELMHKGATVKIQCRQGRRGEQILHRDT